MNPCTPGFSSPTLFIIPDGVSQTLMPSFPGLEFNVSPLLLTPPNFDIS